MVYHPQAQYRCVEQRRRYGGPLCQVIPAGPVDAAVVAAFFAALQPAELNLYDQAMREQRTTAEHTARAQAQQLERLRYEAALAERQFRRVDPDHRLVAGALERHWEEALRALRTAETTMQEQRAAYPPIALSESLRAALTDLGTRLPSLWQTGLLACEHQKALLRCLIDKVVLHRPLRDRVRTRIVWRGGETTTIDVPIAVGTFTTLVDAPAMEEQILAGIQRGQSDHAIAQALTAQGYRSPRHLVVLESTVRNLRLKHRIRRECPRTHPQRPAGYLTIRQLASYLEVAEHRIYSKIYNGQIQVVRDRATRLYLFPDQPDTLVQLQQLKAGAVKRVHLYKGQQDE